MAKKKVLNRIPLSPGMMRLAAVLAEIAQNEATGASTVEFVCAVRDKVERESENPLGSQKSEHRGHQLQCTISEDSSAMC